MNNLASVQKVIKVSEIEGADSIELAHVLGWQCIVKKGEFEVGDLAVYITIDTVVPETDQFEFLRERKFRIKTLKMRGVLSQGLLIPVPQGVSVLEGSDVTNLIGVTKYEKPDNNPHQPKPKMPTTFWKKVWYKSKYNYLYKWFPRLRDKTRSKFPKNLLPITNETRIQSIPHVLETYRGRDFVVNHKLDGSSISIIHDKVFGISRYRICSRRFELHDRKNEWYQVFKSTNFQQYIQRLVDYYNTNRIMVQGEAIGKFNGNHHNLDHNEIRLFNIYVRGKLINQLEFLETCNFLNIPHCPLYNIVKMDHTLEEILVMSDIKDVLNPKVPAEGLVWRCVDGSLSFKAINNKYLLNEK